MKRNRWGCSGRSAQPEGRRAFQKLGLKKACHGVYEHGRQAQTTPIAVSEVTPGDN